MNGSWLLPSQPTLISQSYPLAAEARCSRTFVRLMAIWVPSRLVGTSFGSDESPNTTCACQVRFFPLHISRSCAALSAYNRWNSFWVEQHPQAAINPEGVLALRGKTIGLKHLHLKQASLGLTGPFRWCLRLGSRISQLDAERKCSSRNVGKGPGMCEGIQTE